MPKIFVAEPHGFCFGVRKAVGFLEKIVDKYDSVFVLHEIVHNPFVVNYFKEKGVVFVEDIDSVPDDSVLVFSAQGVSPEVRTAAAQKNLVVFDATCPLVEVVHKKARDYYSKDFSIVYIGKKGHPETVGVLGEAPMTLVSSLDDVETLRINGDENKIVCLNQTTLSVYDTKDIVDFLKEKYPSIVVENGICRATQQRQDAVKTLAEVSDLVFVLGAENSSNSVQLANIARKYCNAAYLILDKSELKDEMLKDAEVIGITSGASCPEFVLEEFVDHIKQKYFISKDS